MRNASLPGTLTWLALLGGAAGARADTGVPAEYRPVVQKALKWLADQQDRRTGHWEAQGQGFPVTMTALSGMALLCEGSTAAEGRYARNIRRARDYLMAKARPDGMIGDPQIPGEAGRYMYGHGFAMLFLSCVYDQEKDADQRKKLEDVLTRAAKFTREAQTSRGGWGYVSARDGGDFDEGSVTVAQVQALRAAHNAGIKVPPEAIKDALKYHQNVTGPDGGVRYSSSVAGGAGRPPLTAATVACWFSAGEFDRAHVKKWLLFCRDNVHLLGKARFGYDEYTNYYYAQAMYKLGDDGYVKLFPDSRAADRLSWTKYRQHTFDFLKNSQAADGSWQGGIIGPVFATAVNLTVLQLDNAVLPIYQR
jgi:hypothetical protein